MPDPRDPFEVFRDLVPINRLARNAQLQLWEHTVSRRLAAGQLVFARGSVDEFVHYVLDGDVDLLDQGQLILRLNPRLRVARRALDATGPKRYTARTNTPALIARVPHTALLRAGEVTRLPGAVEELSASELTAAAVGQDWMERVMASALFRVLPNETIQTVFGAMDALDVVPDERVIEQDTPGEHFFIVESGYFEVTRHAGSARQHVHVGDLRPGDSFGEGSLLSGRPRDASVTALTTGRVLRLAKPDFDRLIRAPLVHGIGVDAAISACRDGARWLDISDPEVYAKAPLRNSRNIPLNALRAQSARLARGDTYVVCCDDPGLSAVGAFVLAEHGFKAFYLTDSIVVLLTRQGGLTLDGTATDAGRNNVVAFPVPPAPSASAAAEDIQMENRAPPPPAADDSPEPTDRRLTQEEFIAATSARLPPDAYAQTHTGQSLARLIEDIDARSIALDQESPTDAGGEGPREESIEFIDFGELEARSAPAPAAPEHPALAPAAEQPTVAAIATPDDAVPVAAPTLPETPVAPSDPVTELMGDFERRVRNYVEANVLERTLEVERRYQEKVRVLEQGAREQLRKREAELRARYAEHHRKKEQSLRDNYQKLMSLANKISQQKAQLQQARTQFEEKLKAANAVYRQVEDMRRALGARGATDPAAGTGGEPRASSR
jgi:CRP-like cAMP-binding protein